MKLVFRFIILAPTVASARDSGLRLIIAARSVVAREIVQLPSPDPSGADPRGHRVDWPQGCHPTMRKGPAAGCEIAPEPSPKTQREQRFSPRGFTTDESSFPRRLRF